MDGNNHGPSYIVGLGQYTGGELWLMDRTARSSWPSSFLSLRPNFTPHTFLVALAISVSLCFFPSPPPTPGLFSFPLPMDQDDPLGNPTGPDERLVEVKDNLRGWPQLKIGSFIKGKLNDIKNNFFPFDGTVPHAAFPFQGNRISIVYCSNTC